MKYSVPGFDVQVGGAPAAVRMIEIPRVEARECACHDGTGEGRVTALVTDRNTARHHHEMSSQPSPTPQLTLHSSSGLSSLQLVTTAVSALPFWRACRTFDHSGAR